jgi:hypothetical protein
MSPDNCPTTCKHATLHYCGSAGTHCDKHCTCSCGLCLAERHYAGCTCSALRLHEDALKKNPASVYRFVHAADCQRLT